ncbi:protein phosphatase 2C domain-containing protein [Ancylothrix sp. C2]|uniref:protein phosphatase 2C domain-containing protein n=1 Tax=Ancylothrix sp. D3o TaxID=2953691 RepID=UPI0021BAB177|nr:zinc ribbon domain-containing protein [Ancylothrix sp. D3o]MCT7949085.1 protein phosphatase 2C domain-containing protein [Ancylothrix sp. D3o]
MQPPAATIYCPNPACETANSETQKFCQKCGNPLPKRYLWAIGSPINHIKPAELIADRYLFKTEQILLDTKPGLLPNISENIPQEITPYLRLFPYRLHIPQLYGQLPTRENTKNPIWLLEQAPIDNKKINIIASETQQPTGHKHPKTILHPPLSRAWKHGSPMRQLNWLWQIAQLWEPLNKEGAASSLFNPHLLRAEGQLVRLLQLQLQPTTSPLSQLGELWLQWVSESQPQIAPFLEKLSHSLIQAEIQTSSHLVNILDRALQRAAISQERSYQLATRTDTGPTRRRNEDACYPNPGHDQKSPTDPLVIVCDGIGGHEGGNVASRCAIDTIRHRLASLKSNLASLSAPSLIGELERATCIANDEISDRNNDEQRLGRQRMGTTLVMALAKNHEVYITHVGDSRAYWISPTGCYQVTLDDDMATREVRLGYAFYRDAVEQPAAGSLVQALGMASSGLLHPSVSRFIIDENAIFLLCSDGLSDNDRVDQCWESELAPVLKGNTDLATAASRLIEVANKENGHDNVTVGLLYCRVKDNPNAGVFSNLLLSDLETAVQNPENLSHPAGHHSQHTANTVLSTATTQLIPRSPSPTSGGGFKSPLPWLLAIAALLGIPVLAYFTLPELQEKINPLIGRPATSTTAASPVAPNTEVSPTSLEAGAIIRTQLPSPEAGSTQTEIEPSQIERSRNLQVFAKAGGTETLGTLSTGSILKILEKQPLNGINWLNVQVCWLHPHQKNFNAKIQPTPENKPASISKKLSPTRTNAQIAATPKPELPIPSPGLNVGETGWVREDELLPLVVNDNLNPQDLSPEIQAQCATTP